MPLLWGCAGQLLSLAPGILKARRPWTDPEDDRAKTHTRTKRRRPLSTRCSTCGGLSFGAERIVWYLARYHDIKISDAGVYRVLKRHGVSRLPGKVGRRAVHTTRYEKIVPGHHIQLDVKFLSFKARTGATIKRFQYTAIDDATRIRALKIYNKHNQINAMDFVDYVIEKFPFRIQMIRTDRGHEFQAIPLACRGSRHSTRLHQATIASAQRQGRALAPLRSGRVLSAS